MIQFGRVQRSRAAGASTLAKITRPSLSGVFARGRLYRLLDQARRKHPIIWISAPAGAGKTTLIASYLQARKLPALWYQMDAGDNDVASFFYYLGLAAKEAASRYRRPMPLLTREYIAGLPAFTANYFRELFGRLKRPGLLVFDNYQDIPGEAGLHDVLQRGFAEIPAQTNVMVLSREDPPGNFARLLGSGHIAILGWEALKLTEQESAGIVKRRKRNSAFTRDAMQRLYRKTEGWVAGVVLLTEYAERKLAGAQLSKEPASEGVFDYFATEIFRHAECNVQTFLLKTAFLPKISLAVAQALTDESNSESILTYLTRRNLFTVQHADGSYEYHPLFREFLATRARELYNEEQFKAIKQESATLLAESGDVENAVSLLLQSPPNWAEALALILEQASLLSATGRTRTLETWLEALPESIRVENPWALYWLGVCRLAFSPADARRYLERAFALFEKQTDQTDASPLYLTWSGIIESFVLERNDFTPMRKWLDIYRTLATKRAPPSADIETASVFTYVLGLINASFDHPDLPVYAERAAQLLVREPNADRWFVETVALLPYYLWRGDLVETRKMLESMAVRARSPEASPLTRLYWYAWKCLYDGPTGATEESLRSVQAGLALADCSGIHVCDTQLLGYGIWGQLCAGNVRTARELLQRMPPLIGRGQISNAFYSHFASLVLLHEGDIVRAVEEARRAAYGAGDGGLFIGAVSYLIGLAFALTQQGDLSEAKKVLSEVQPKAASMNSKLFVWYAALCEANIYRAQGDFEQTRRALRQALTLAKEIGTVTPAYCPRKHAAALYAIALDADIESDYVRATIANTRLAPPDALSDRWPWPLRIYTLGRFAVMRGDQPLALGARARKKPLELLRAVIIFGRPDVSVNKLAQLLWPEAEGDLVRRNIETTLHRLRRLIGEECILRQENRLSLNFDRCWSDVIAFELLAERESTLLSPAVQAQQLLDLYRGPFLGEDDTPSALILRERLRAKFIRVLAQLGERLETQAKHDAAIQCYEKGIDVEPLAEELYRRLMECHLRLRCPAEALGVYRRCQAILASELHIEPAEQTQSLYKVIQRSAP